VNKSKNFAPVLTSAKSDPSFPWDRANPNRIRMMEIHFSGAGQPYDQG